MKYNYKIVVEMPRDLWIGRQRSEVTVDRVTQFFYGRKNKESALRAFGSVKNLKLLRKQGFNITRSEYKKYRNRFLVERV